LRGLLAILITGGEGGGRFPITDREQETHA
jgi:hypothetical protein